MTASVETTEPLDMVPADRWPRHVAIIMDGNGRWAERRGLVRAAGHEQGVRTVRRITEECSRLGRIRQLTLYCLSSENWKRPQSELDFLMQLLKQYLIEERARIMANDLRVQMLGRRDGIPQPVLDELDTTITTSSGNKGMGLNLAINYGGRGEIVDAARAIARGVREGRIDPEAIDEATVSDHLYTAGVPDPDLLIRTAGELRISNFLLWQVSYSEIWVTDDCWPEFNEQTLHRAIRDFASRERRFGGLNNA